MLEGYHRSFNNHALNALARPVDIPDLALGVGWAEKLQSEKIQLLYEPEMRTAIIADIKTIEDAGVKGQGNQVPLSRFKTTSSIDEVLAGMGGW